MMKTIADQLKTEALSLESRGLPSDSYFYVLFYDGSSISEKNYNWREIAEEQYVIFNNTKKVVQASKYPIERIEINHAGLRAVLTANQDEQVYQSIISIAVLSTNGEVVNKIVGRRVGKIKDGKVIEERFIDGRTNEVIGLVF